MADREFNLNGDQLFSAPKSPADKRLNSNADFTPDIFDRWWQKTFAQHTAVASEAPDPMRLHRQVSSTEETSAGNPN